jgi:hypothetical protein
MTVPNGDTTTDDTTTPADELPNEETTDEVTPEDAAEVEEAGEKSQLSHDDALAALAKVRKEAAASRTRAREAEEKLSAAKTPEEVEAAIQSIKDANASDAKAMLIENVALKHKLPDDLASALKGNTREELEAHAKVLAKYAPVIDSDDPDLEGGLRPGDSGDEAIDMAAHVARIRQNRY